MLSCILGGKYLHVIGREVAIIIGMLFITVQQIGLYEVAFVQGANSFLFWSFTAQLIGGLGSGVNAVASMAMVVSSSKASERE